MDNQEQNNLERKSSSYLIPISIIIAGALVAGAVWFQSGKKIDTTANISGKLAKVEIGNLPLLGNAEAKVTLVEFGDYQCPFCGRLFKETEPQIREQYLKTGQAKMAWRDFAFLGEESYWAAEAARCANDQGQFWQFHDYLFNHQNGENQGAFTKNNLKKFAGEMGLNQPDFNSCLDSDKYLQAVKDDTDAGKAAGVNSTPSVFVNGENIVGAQPFSVFKSAIDKYLK